MSDTNPTSNERATFIELLNLAEHFLAERQSEAEETALRKRIADTLTKAPAIEPTPRHTLDCDMVKHPNCTRCNCGSSIDARGSCHHEDRHAAWVCTRCGQYMGEMPPVETTTGHCIDCIELKNALAAAVKVANEARECHDRDQDMRTMKLLIALSGHLPKWRADTDRIHDVLRRAVERLSAPMPPVEPAREHLHWCAVNIGKDCNCWCNHPRSELLARKGNQFEMRKCLDCQKIFRVRLPEKSPVKAGDPCLAFDATVHEAHEGKCMYCGAPMPQVKASGEYCSNWPCRLPRYHVGPCNSSPENGDGK